MEEGCDSEDNPWDDTLLIKAYDRAVNLAKANLGKNVKSSKENVKMDCTANEDSFKEPKSKGKQPTSSSACWTVGSKCRAIWSHDGVEYEAEVISMKPNKNQARVRFIGYNNEETTKLNSLKPSQGEDARQKQITESQGEIEENGYFGPSPLDRTSQGEEGMMFPPPPPPHVISYLPKDEQEALSAMLMSWYMSGYHTGYYQGLISGRQNCANKKK